MAMPKDKGTMIPITFTQGADAKDISDAIGDFLQKYDSEHKTDESDDNEK